MNDAEQASIGQHLRRLDEKVDRALDDLREIKQRFSSVEVSVARLHGDLTGVRSDSPISS